MKILMSVFSKAIPFLGGAKSYLVGIVLKYGGQLVADMFGKLFDKILQKIKKNKAVEEQKEAVKEDQDAQSKESEKARRDAFTDGVNSL